MSSASTERIVLLFFILLKFFLQYYLIHPSFELHRDEYLHIDQGRHLAWGYESVPPLTSWLSWFILKMPDQTFWVKFVPALFGVLSMYVVWKTIKALQGNLFALCMGAIAMIFSVLLRINMLYQPNSVDIFSWTLMYFLLIKFLQLKEPKWLYFAAIAFALGFLNKYNIAFLILGLIPSMLLTSPATWFKNKHLYFAAVLAFLLILPNVIWQQQNEWPVFHHMKELKETQLDNLNYTDFLKGQLLFFLGSLYVVIAGMISFFMYPPFRKYQFIFWSFVFTVIIFMLFHAKDYYTIGLYPILLAFGAVYLETITKKNNVLRVVLLVIPVMVLQPFLTRFFPVEPASKISEASKKNGLHKWENGKEYDLPQDFADMLGWKELAHKTDSASKLISDHSETIILCDNYGMAGGINYYTQLGLQAVSLNADYINWFPDKKISVVISVKEKDSDMAIEKQLFDSIRFCGQIENKYARERGTSIYILSNPKADINALLKSEIKKRKQRS